MWQIYIEAVVSPGEVQFSSKDAEVELRFGIAMAVRGKNSDEQEWHTVFSQFGAEDADLSTVTVSCDIEADESQETKVCDSFEVGIIGHLDYEMYDIAIMITNTPEELLAHDLATVSFRLSHLNDGLLSWHAGVRLFCLLFTAAMLVGYFLKSVLMKSQTLSIEQYWVITLLCFCIMYNEPLFEVRRNHPSVALAVISEIPASVFFTALLAYWLTGVTYVRVKAKQLANAKKVTINDIVGVFSFKRLSILICTLLSFAIL